MREDASGVDGARGALALMAVLGATLGCLALASPTALGAVAAAPLAAMLRGRARRARLARRLAVLLPIVVPATVLRVAWSTGTTPITLLGLATTHEALHAGAVTALRIGAAALWTTWLSTALTPMELERALRRVGVPRSLVELVAHTRRFAAQLGATLRSAWTAAALRGSLTSTRSALRALGLVAGVVVVRAIDRSGHVALSLALRGHVARDVHPTPAVAPGAAGAAPPSATLPAVRS